MVRRHGAAFQQSNQPARWQALAVASLLGPITVSHTGVNRVVCYSALESLRGDMDRCIFFSLASAAAF